MITDDAERMKLRKRLRQLAALESQVRAEIDVIRDKLDAKAAEERRAEWEAERAARKAAAKRPPCNTERGYQWHRYNDRDNWPLPTDDPCGCRAAHAAWWHFTKAEKGSAA